jgi:hypothetical protein
VCVGDFPKTPLDFRKMLRATLRVVLQKFCVPLCASCCKSSGCHFAKMVRVVLRATLQNFWKSFKFLKKIFQNLKLLQKSQNFCKVARYVVALLTCVNLQKCALLCENVAKKRHVVALLASVEVPEM